MPFIFAIISLILIGVSLFGPWYSMRIEGEVDMGDEKVKTTSELSYTLREVKTEYEGNGTKKTESRSFDNELYKDSKAVEAIKTTR